MELCRKRHCDVLLVWKYDRFARSVSHLVRTLGELRGLGVGFVSFQDGVDTNTPQGRMVFTFLAGIAEFERELIIERVRSGIRRARVDGTLLGRAAWKKRAGTISEEQRNQILALRGQRSVRDIAGIVGLSKSAVANVLSTRPTQNAGLSLVGGTAGI